MSETDEKVMANFEKVGGPAFPATWTLPSGGSLDSPGMTLRDWFAGQALASIPSHLRELQTDQRIKIADWAYGMADAMLVERVKATESEADT